MQKQSFEFILSPYKALDLASLLVGKAGEMTIRIAKEGRASIIASNLELDDKLSARISILFPDLESWIVKDGERERFVLQIPDLLVGVVSCPNPNCVSSQPREPASPEFAVVTRKPLLLLCLYCGRYLYGEQISKQTR